MMRVGMSVLAKALNLVDFVLLGPCDSCYLLISIQCVARLFLETESNHAWNPGSQNIRAHRSAHVYRAFRRAAGEGESSSSSSKVSSSSLNSFIISECRSSSRFSFRIFSGKSEEVSRLPSPPGFREIEIGYGCARLGISLISIFCFCVHIICIVYEPFVLSRVLFAWR